MDLSLHAALLPFPSLLILYFLASLALLVNKCPDSFRRVRPLAELTVSLFPHCFLIGFWGSIHGVQPLRDSFSFIFNWFKPVIHEWCRLK